MIVVAFVVAGINFLLDFLNENKRQKELELNFLEFVRALVETVRSGVTIPSAVMQISDANYGSLTPYIKKLANQLEWGYPLHEALTIFAVNTKNAVIKKSVAIVIQAERSGGDMGIVLQAVTNSVVEVKNIKEERKTNAYSQMIQGYIIFFVFIIKFMSLVSFGCAEQFSVRVSGCCRHFLQQSHSAPFLKHNLKVKFVHGKGIKYLLHADILNQ